MTDSEFQTMTAAMLMYGGSFTKVLAQTLRLGDSHNRERLLRAFPELVDGYGPGSWFYQQVEAQHENV